ncbi:MAG TPA: TetR/AcrR family transcriptional regulator [Vicinamibacterales bacterium]|jgi:AcrR family transcriptional regulator|nr:TetR/AcrR family transcriptional regulator [Vicinamibacterales bacterium]
MAPRPRTVSDEDLINATMRVMSRLGPVKLTLAEVAKEAGVTAATLVQRFGSKRAMMLKISSDAAGSADACFAMVRAAHPRSPLAAIYAAATAMTEHMGTPEELANSLAFLQIDISDPDFHAHTLEMSKKHVAGYRALLKDAIAAGELEPHDTLRMARAINAIAGGSLIAWAIFREGTAERWVRRDVETLLAPYRP